MAELNRRTLDTVYVNLYGDELYHHGVLGQSWGDRNGPPYPLGGVDKKVARAEYKAKKEKERRLKKMQKAAKKARKMKAKEAKNQAEILKKKQKLVKEGDLDKIRKNAELFTNEELQYIIERDAQKRAIGSTDERTNDEKLELFMKRFGQIATIAASAKTVLEAGKAGAEMINSFKAGKVKDLEAEEKRWSRIEKEFDTRFKADPDDATRFLYDITGNEDEAKEMEKQIKRQRKAEKVKAKDEELTRIEQKSESAARDEVARQKLLTVKEAKQERKEAEKALKDRKKNFKDANKKPGLFEKKDAAEPKSKGDSKSTPQNTPPAYRLINQDNKNALWSPDGNFSTYDFAWDGKPVSQKTKEQSSKNGHSFVDKHGRTVTVATAKQQAKYAYESAADLIRKYGII